MRTKNAIRNLITGILPQLVIGILGFYKIKFFITALGVEFNGLNQLFAQIFAYMNLAEGGIGFSIQYRLYKLLSSEDYVQINKLLKGAKILYRRSAFLIICASIVLSFNLSLFIKNSPFDPSVIAIIFMLYLINCICPYFFTAERLLLSSDQKLYKISIVMNTSLVLKTLTEIALLIIGTNMYVFVSVSIIYTFLSFIIIYYLARNEYPWYSTKNVKADMSFTIDMKHLLPLKILDVVLKNTDIIVISSFLGIFYTSVYGFYNYVLGFIVASINQLSAALFSIIGNYSASEPIEKIKNLFDEYLMLTILIANVLCIPIVFAINGFITLWVGDQMIVDHLTVIFFVAIMYYNIIMIPLATFVSVNGLFKEIKVSAFIEMVVNITLSIVLVNILGLKGVLIGTIVSMFMSRFIYSPNILYHRLFHTSSIEFYITMAKNAVLMLILYFSIAYIFSFLHFTNLIQWFLSGIIIFSVNLVLTLGLTNLFFAKNFKLLFMRLKRKAK